MTTYLVGLDASDHARDALSWAVAVAREEDPVVAVHAWDLPVVTGYEAGAVDPSEAEASARDFVRSMVAEHDEGRVDARIADGPAGRALVDAAAALGPDVVVVVGHGGSGKTSLLLGSTAHHLVHHAHVPVVVVRGELRVPVRRARRRRRRLRPRPRRRRPLDGRAALGAAPARRRPTSTSRTPTSCRRSPPVPSREPGLESDEETAEDDSRLRRAIDEATDGTGVAPNGAEILPVVAAGTGAFAMIEASRDADLVVIGTRGRSGLRRADRRLDDPRGAGPRPLPRRRRALTGRLAAPGRARTPSVGWPRHAGCTARGPRAAATLDRGRRPTG